VHPGAHRELGVGHLGDEVDGGLERRPRLGVGDQQTRTGALDDALVVDDTLALRTSLRRALAHESSAPHPLRSPS
jgi:hypothetical protein